MISHHSSGILSQVSIVPHVHANAVGLDPFAQGTVSNSWPYVFSPILCCLRFISCLHHKNYFLIGDEIFLEVPAIATHHVFMLATILAS